MSCVLRIESVCKNLATVLPFVEPFVVGANACLDDLRLARKELMSSALDFSKAGRRINEGPPFIILLKNNSHRYIPRGICRRIR